MGGEHKCPMCAATFTRPQHVGRHLRAHTGERPYKCEDCELRFARSDLLSRHVNKAHKSHEDGVDGKDKDNKKGRRKSMPTMNEGRVGEVDRRASVDLPPSHIPNARPEPPALQAQSMYPHHPLLTNTPATSTTHWTSALPGVGMNGVSPTNIMPTYTLSNTTMPPTSSQPVSTGQMAFNPLYSISPVGGYTPGFTATPMRMTGSDQSVGATGMGRGLSGTGYEFGYKKRACDQCNHSKVKCNCDKPCARCSQREMKCTYDKPAKSRSFAMFNDRLGTTGSLTSSPSSQMSSPYSNHSTSPINTALPGPNFQRRSASMSDHIDATRQQPYMSNPAMAWGPATFPPPTTQLAISNEQWRMQHAGNSNMKAPAPPVSSMQVRGNSVDLQSIQGSNGTPPNAPSASPQMHLAPTPSLTSLTASPSGSEELPERRISQTQVPMSIQPNWQIGKGFDSSQQMSFDPSYSIADYRPINNAPPQMIGGGSATLNSMSWKPDNLMHASTIDPRQQLLDPLASDDDDYTSGPLSSRNSVSQAEVDDHFVSNDYQDQRRSSTSSGIWANAFDQMSLQDSAAIAMAAATLAGTDMSNPFNASQIAQTFRRPSFPLQPGSEQGEGRMPSYSDVKELWRMFMAEPMTGPTPNANGDRPNPLETSVGGGHTHTPRPSVGRTLSKSNSMPDLTSPSLYATQQHNQNNNANVTPRPAQPQASYIPSQQPAPNQDEDEGVVLHKWKSQIQQRQASFSMSMVPNAKMGKAVATAEPNNNDTPPTNRPLPSVFQSAALQQTLAPERAPSYGMGGFEAQPTPTGHFSRTPSKLAAMRPGNKRLASQTLGPEDAKAQKSDPAWQQADGSSRPMGPGPSTSGDGVSRPMGLSQSYGGSSSFLGDAAGLNHGAGATGKAVPIPPWMTWGATAAAVPIGGAVDGTMSGSAQA